MLVGKSISLDSTGTKNLLTSIFFLSVLARHIWYIFQNIDRPYCKGILFSTSVFPHCPSGHSPLHIAKSFLFLLYESVHLISHQKHGKDQWPSPCPLPSNYFFLCLAGAPKRERGAVPRRLAISHEPWLGAQIILLESTEFPSAHSKLQAEMLSENLL